MEKTDIEQTVMTFIKKNIKDNDLVATTDYFATGAASSLLAMQIIMFLEDTFDITVSNDEMEMSNFNTVEHISEFVEKKVTPNEN